MIISSFESARRYMGRLDAGQDLLAGLKIVCRENRVTTAWIQASAVLYSPTLSQLRPDGTGLREPGIVDGACFCPTLTGNVSMEGDALDIRLYGTCHPAKPESASPVAGVVRGGQVILCEFLLLAGDEMTFVRQPDDRSGFGPWILLQAAGAMPRIPVTAAIQAPPHPPSRTPQGPINEEEANELIILEMQEGDYVDHPRFGLCRVVHAPTDDRVSVRLPQGKQVDLHLGVMRVLPAKMQGGRKVFQVEVKRRA
jgi:predicted DNA-binding protein with PD1-like motif